MLPTSSALLKASLYFHTLRHLRFSQILWLLGKKLPRRSLQPPKHEGVRMVVGQWKSGPARPQSLFKNGRARFLGIERSIKKPSDWMDCRGDLLWLYNLHYFDDLNCGTSLGNDRRAIQEDWLLRWILENPQESHPGWDPYPTALRIVNWVRAALEGFPLPAEAIESLALQANHLRSHLEYHLLGNHLWADAKGLVFAGLFLKGMVPDGWFETGMRILKAQIKEQVLDDGGHFERSPMYHAIIHEDLLDLIQVLQVYDRPVPSDWPELARKMADWSCAMRHPDGDIPFFNDAAFGIAASHEERGRYSRSLGIEASNEVGDGIGSLPHSGYYRIQRGNFVLLCDAAEVGPDYQPGHAHADTLSFEMSFCGERFFVNTGTSCYGESARRKLERGSPAHNSVCVDGQDSSEVWGGFRVARRARILETSVTDREGESTLAASHDGYSRLLHKQVHSREWVVHPNQVVIRDSLESAPHRGAVASLHLAPGIEVSASGGQGVKLTCGSGAALTLSFEGGKMLIEDYSWAPRFGVLQPAKVLRIQLDGRESVIKIQAENPA